MSEKSKDTLTSSRDASDVRAVSLGLWASGLRCVIVYVIAPVVGVFGPFGVGLALVVQAAGAIARACNPSTLGSGGGSIT